MESRFFFEESKVFLAVNQDCSVTEFNTLKQACAISPIYVLRAKSRYENVTYNGTKQQWYRGGHYTLFCSSGSEVDEISFSNWLVKDISFVQDGSTMRCKIIDPLGKVLSQSMENKNLKETIANIFLKARETSNYESILNYELREQNKILKQEIEDLKNILKLLKS